MANNYFSAPVQLKSLENRLKKDQPLRKKYSNIIKEELNKYYVVRVKDAHEVESRLERERYLPHHPAVNPNKVRRVLNEAAKIHGASLDKSLLTGPDLILNQSTHAVQTTSICRIYRHRGNVPPSWSFTIISHHCTFCGGKTPHQMLWYTSIHATFSRQDLPTCANYALQRTASD